MTTSLVLYHNVQVIQQLIELTRNNPLAIHHKTRTRRDRKKDVPGVADPEELRTLQAETLETSAAFDQLMSSVRNPRRLQECWCGECPLQRPENIAGNNSEASAVSGPFPIQEFSIAESEMKFKDEILDIEMPLFQEVRLNEDDRFSGGQTYEEEDPLQI
ncbi:uncharacterized protein LOC122502167 [Leptopilina heterotoma]|uniref:uncharacterized protein LOC122502167 n=1 Tax=Leptopilina heterotoma TaxID=63436 RepID=UPI001CA8A217|nr:uncharacterized protein LOC122502167 [Leptopilina heterotoma]